MAEEGPRSPPSQDVVAYRALCLSALQFRGIFEHAYRTCRELGDEALEGLFARAVALKAWISVEGLDLHLSGAERTLFAKDLGTWREQEFLNAIWRNEALGVLLWALGQTAEIPPYDQQFGDVDQCIAWLEPAPAVLARVRLRPAVEIERARNVAELWNWRARTTRLQQTQWRLAKRHNLPAVIRRVAHLAYENGDAPAPIKDDFPAFGKPYARLSQREHSEAESIAMERHFALNWLCGYSEDWDSTPTDT
jgi:Domain of unknown function (DUF4272)